MTNAKMGAFRSALYGNFRAFATKVFAELNGGNLPEDGAYLRIMSAFAADVSTRKILRGIVSMPPRHLKTLTFSIALPAWLLGHNPARKIMLVTYGDELSADIADKLRRILRSNWYQQCFPTRISPDRSAATDFTTTAGGQFHAPSIGGALTGRGADLIIVDDAVKIGDAANVAVHDKVFNRFAAEIATRLDNSASGQILVVGHRLHAKDLIGRLEEQPGWQKLTLPFIADEAAEVCWGSETWHRKAGELLRPEAFSAPQITEMRNSSRIPDFETLQQQNPSGVPWASLSDANFPTFDSAVPDNAPVVISVDPAQANNPRASFWVAQAWAIVGGTNVLVDQFRAQTGFEGMVEAVKRLIRRHQPSLILIEETSTGTALRERIRGFKETPLEMVPAPRTGKLDRLKDCVHVILEGKVRVIGGADFRDEFIGELLAFPHSGFDDQVDAMTQALKFFLSSPRIPPRPKRAIAAVASRSGLSYPGSGTQATPGGSGSSICVWGRRPSR